MSSSEGRVDERCDRASGLKRRVVTWLLIAASSLGLAIGWVAAIDDVDAQVSDVTATITVNPASTMPGTTLQVSAVFTPNVTVPPYRVGIVLSGTNGQGTIASPPVSVSSGLSNCTLDSVPLNAKSLVCDWTTGLDTPQTLVVTVNVGAGAVPGGSGSWNVYAIGAPTQSPNENQLSNIVHIFIQLPSPTTTTSPAEEVAATPNFTG